MTDKKKIDDSELAEISGAGEVTKIQPGEENPGEGLDSPGGGSGGGGGATGGPESDSDGGGLTEPQVG